MREIHGSAPSLNINILLTDAITHPSKSTRLISHKIFKLHDTLTILKDSFSFCLLAQSYKQIKKKKKLDQAYIEIFSNLHCKREVKKQVIHRFNILHNKVHKWPLKTYCIFYL